MKRRLLGNRSMLVLMSIKKTVSVMSEELHYKTFSAPPQADKLSNYLRANFPGAAYYSAYEAGFSGFWLRKELTKLGIKSIVVNPGDNPTTVKERRHLVFKH